MPVVAADAVDVGGQMDRPTLGDFLDLPPGHEHGVLFHDGGLGPVTEKGKQPAPVGHQRQLGQDHRRVGRLEIAELGLDVAEAHRTGEHLGGGMGLQGVEEGVGHPEDVQVGHVGRVHRHLMVATSHGLAVSLG